MTFSPALLLCLRRLEAEVFQWALCCATGCAVPGTRAHFLWARIMQLFAWPAGHDEPGECELGAIIMQARANQRISAQLERGRCVGAIR